MLICPRLRTLRRKFHPKTRSKRLKNPPSPKEELESKKLFKKRNKEKIMMLIKIQRRKIRFPNRKWLRERNNSNSR
jgi:hypothetical protein